MTNYFIKTKRLGFSTWNVELLTNADYIWSDLNVTKFIGGAMTNKDIKKKLESEIENEKRYGIQYWPLFLLKTNEIIGCCGLRPYRIKDNIFEIGFHISSNHWRKGYAYEAANEVKNYAFYKLNASSLFAGHNPKNQASGYLLKKLGFTYSHEEYYQPTGLNHPSYFLDIKDFKEQNV